MPWTVSGVVEKREDFLADFVSGDWTMSELCRLHGISRPTGYAVLRRYTADGDQGLAERSHAPQRHPNQTPAEALRLIPRMLCKRAQIQRIRRLTPGQVRRLLLEHRLS